MNLNKYEMNKLLTDALENNKAQSDTNRLNAETINDLVEMTRHLRNALTQEESKTERYKKMYTELWWRTKKIRDTENAYNEKLDEESTEH